MQRRKPARGSEWYKGGSARCDMHKILSIILLFLAVMAVSSAPAGKNWQSDPDWIKTRYGAWGGPGVDAAPGPMDAVELKNYAPKSSLVLAETSVPKAKYPVIYV